MKGLIHPLEWKPKILPNYQPSFPPLGKRKLMPLPRYSWNWNPLKGLSLNQGRNWEIKGVIMEE